MKSTLGKFAIVDPRQIWKNESTDFTPWLASEEGIALLGDALGLELEVENTEVAVGPYSADILATDVGTGRTVVIENQLARTDHSHLGQLLTYSSVLDASAVVWLATEFSHEHSSALDWLNEHTSDDLSFYGVRVEVWKIENSPPAVRFNVLSSPPDSTRKVAKQKAESELTEAKRLQLDFWTELEPRLRASEHIPSTHTPRPQYWYDVALGHSDIFLSNTASTEHRRVGIRVYLRERVSEQALAQLLEQKEEIEKELGHQLQWNPNPENRDKIIMLSRKADIWDRDKWPGILDWMEENIIKFRQTFAPRIKQLDLSAENDGAEE